MIRTAVWPSSWKARIRCSGMPRPTWMSGEVTSMPSFTRSGRPRASFCSRAPCGSTSTAFRVSSAMATAGTLEMRDLERLEAVGGLEAEDPPDEPERGLDRAADVLLLAEAVAFPLEREVRVRDPLPIERLRHHLGLPRQHDPIVE